MTDLSPSAETESERDARRVGIPAWLRSPQAIITVALVAFATGFVVLNLRPALWFQDTTPTGGDMGAHVWSPAYLRDILLPAGRLTGWSPDWYAGFPAFTFYMIIPSLLVVIVNVGLAGGPVVSVGLAGCLALGAVTLRSRWGTTTERACAVYGIAFLLWLLIVPIPYGAAMKLVVVAGLVTLPVAAYLAGRLGGLAFPGPGLLAVMTLPFLFDRSYNIYGGNLMSTMAGEFAYSLGLSIAVVYIGVAARGLETGRHRGLAAALLALAGLTHLFAAFFALVATIALLLVRPGVRTGVWTVVMGATSGLLAAFWILPFFWNRALLNDMGWGKERRYVAALWDRGDNFGDQTFLVNDPPMQVLIGLAVLGLVLSGIRRIRFGMALGLVAIIFAAAFLLLPEGRLWNVRLLPFYYLSINLLAGVAIAEVGRLFVVLVRSASPWRRALTAAGPAILATVVLWVSLGLPLRSLPGGSLDGGTYSWLGFETEELNLGPYWLSHNFNGYEGTAAWAEYAEMIAVMDRVGDEFGCGRSLWEYESGRLGSYGTPMAPMLLPHWTDGCIGSMEGLYFEASATTPYHFLLQSEMSRSPSRAQRDLPYSGLDVAQGVGHLQTMGVRYYLAFTDEAVIQAQADPRLTEIATAHPWVMFLVQDSDLVVALDHLPVVVDGVQGGGEEWLVPSVAWWSADQAPLVAADGPAWWPRTSMRELEESTPGLAAAIEADTGRVGEMNALAASLPALLPAEPAEPVTVTDVVADEFTISFTVDQVGVPVLVRTSYFPNWQVSGGEGPYRVTPNLMVVVPTDTDVELSYGRSTIEIVSILLSLIGTAALVMMRRIPQPDAEPLWDLGASPVDRLPSQELVISEIEAGRPSPATIDKLTDATATRLHAQGRRIMVAITVVALTLIGHIVISPKASEPITSLIVWAPGAWAAFVLVTSLLPGLGRLFAYRSTVVEPARIAVGVVTRAQQADPVESDDPAPSEPPED